MKKGSVEQRRAALKAKVEFIERPEAMHGWTPRPADVEVEPR